MTDDRPSMGTDEEDLVPFSVKLGHPTEITLHGVDIARDLEGLQITAQGREPAEVILRLSAKATARTEFEGLAHVVIGDVLEEPGPAAAAFLGAIDAELLERTALSRMDLDTEPHGTTRAILRQLIEWANGGA